MKQWTKLSMVLGLVGALMLGSGVLASAAEYTIDTVHSTIGFAVKHMLVSTTRGLFTDYEGKIAFDPTDLSTFAAQATVQVASINTHNEKRDTHLRGTDFLDAGTFGVIQFKSTQLIAQEDGGYILNGDLTIRDITRAITIPVEISGPVQSPFGGNVIGLAGEVSINRQDFGVSWNKSLDSGGLVVADEVKLIVEIEAINKPVVE